MSITDHREIAETAFRRNPKRDEINEALKQEHARREAAVKNLYRLRVGWRVMQSQTTALEKSSGQPWA